MSEINDTDKFLVNRGGTSYQLQSQNLMAELQDTDLMLVNRAGVSYKATGLEIKQSIGPAGEVDTPSIIAPSDGAGIEVKSESDPIIDVETVSLSLTSKWTTPNIKTYPSDSGGPFKEDFGYVYFMPNDTTPMNWDATSNSSFPQSISGSGTLEVAWSGASNNYAGNYIKLYNKVTEEFVEVGWSNSGNSTSSATLVLGIDGDFEFDSFDLLTSGNQTGGFAGFYINGKKLVDSDDTTTLTLSGNRGLTDPVVFLPGDPVEQDSGYTPVTSAITNVSTSEGDAILNFTDDTNLENFRVGDFVTTGATATVPTCIDILQTGSSGGNAGGPFSTPEQFNAFWNPDKNSSILAGKGTNNYVTFYVPAGEWIVYPQRVVGYDQTVSVSGTFSSGPTGFIASSSQNNPQTYIFDEPGEIKFTLTGAAGGSGYVFKLDKTTFNGDLYSIPALTGGFVSNIYSVSNQLNLTNVIGTFTTTDTVVGPETTPATGIVGSVDSANNKIILSESDQTYPKRWIQNQGKYVDGGDVIVPMEQSVSDPIVGFTIDTVTPPTTSASAKTFDASDFPINEGPVVSNWDFSQATDRSDGNLTLGGDWGDSGNMFAIRFDTPTMVVGGRNSSDGYPAVSMALVSSDDGINWTLEDFQEETPVFSDPLTCLRGSSKHLYWGIYRYVPANGPLLVNPGMNGVYSFGALSSEEKYLTFTGDKDLSGGSAFEVGDEVSQSAGYTPVTSAVTVVSDTTYPDLGAAANWTNADASSGAYLFAEKEGTSNNTYVYNIANSNDIVWTAPSGGLLEGVGDKVYLAWNSAYTGPTQYAGTICKITTQFGTVDVTCVPSTVTEATLGFGYQIQELRFVKQAGNSYNGGLSWISPSSSESDKWISNQDRTTLTLTDNTNLENLRVGDQITQAPTDKLMSASCSTSIYTTDPFNDALFFNYTGLTTLGPYDVTYYVNQAGVFTVNMTTASGGNTFTTSGTFSAGPTSGELPGTTLWDFTFDAPGYVTFHISAAPEGSSRNDTVGYFSGYLNRDGYQFDGVAITPDQYQEAPSGNIIAIDPNNNQIAVTDDSTFVTGIPLTGPATTPATGVVGSLEPSNNKMILSSTDISGSKRWIANAGLTVANEPKEYDGVDSVGLDIYGSAFASTPVGSLAHTASSWQVALFDDYYFTSPVAQSIDNTSELEEWAVPVDLDGDTKYRCRVRYQGSNTVESEWSKASTFKTASTNPLINKAGNLFALYKSETSLTAASENPPVKIINVVNSRGSVGDRLLAIGVDGKIYISTEMRNSWPTVSWSVFSEYSDNKAIALSCVYSGDIETTPWIVLNNDNTISINPDGSGDGLPMSMPPDDAGLRARNIIAIGSVPNYVGFTTTDGENWLYAMSDNLQFGSKTLTAGAWVEAAITIPDETIIKICGIADSGSQNYMASNLAILTESGNLYTVVTTTIGWTGGPQSGGTNASPNLWLTNVRDMNPLDRSDIKGGLSVLKKDGSIWAGFFTDRNNTTALPKTTNWQQIGTDTDWVTPMYSMPSNSRYWAALKEDGLIYVGGPESLNYSKLDYGEAVLPNGNDPLISSFGTLSAIQQAQAEFLMFIFPH